MVHRDVSPHNILVGTDGAARIVDFGIAKAAWRAHVTQHGQLKGKPGYMAPEQLTMAGVDRRTDVYAAGIVLWELLVGRRLFRDQSMRRGVPFGTDWKIPRPSSVLPHLPPRLDEVVLSALSLEPKHRFPDARAMAEALMDAAPPARDAEVGAWVSVLARDELRRRGELMAELENVQLSGSATLLPRAPEPGAHADSLPESGTVEAPPSGYVAGLHEPTAVPLPPARRRGWRTLPSSVTASMMLAGAGALLAASHVVTSRSSPSAVDVRGRVLAGGDSRPTAETPVDVARVATSSEPEPTSRAMATTPVAPPVANVAALKAVTEGPADRGRPARRPAAPLPAASASSTLSVPGRDPQPSFYDPLRDGRRL
jgi:serine/threonine-protein kinase